MLPMQRPVFRKYIYRLANRGQIDEQGIDFDAHYDPTLSWSENTSVFLDTYPRLQEGRRRVVPYESHGLFESAYQTYGKVWG